MKRSVLFAVVVCLSLGAHAHQSTTNAAGAWKYAWKGPMSYSATWYATSLGELDGMTESGYATDSDAKPGWFKGDGPELLFRTYATWIVSENDMTLYLASGGNDGHSIFVDGELVAGGGFGVDLFFDLELHRLFFNRLFRFIGLVPESP